MKQTILLIFISIIIFTASCNSINEIADAESYKTTKSKIESIKSTGEKNLVLVELFTSEG